MIAFLVITIIASCSKSDSIGIVVKEEIGARGPFQLTFSQEVLIETVESRFHLVPAIQGRFEWKGSNLLFYPSQLLEPGEEYQLILDSGLEDKNGDILTHPQKWVVRVRQPQIIYQFPSIGNRQIWIASQDGKTKTEISHALGEIFDVSISPDGEKIVYSVQDVSGGIDLWEVTRTGEEETLIIDCGVEWCVNPAWSPDMKFIAFSKGPEGAEPGIGSSTAQIWLFDISRQISTPIIENQAEYGIMPSWSPDGSWLAYFNQVEQKVSILNLQNLSIIAFSSNRSGISWAPNSGSILINYSLETDLPPHNIIYEVDFAHQQEIPLLNSETDFKEYGLPIWTPDGEWVTVSVRCAKCSPTRQIWMMRPSGDQAAPLWEDQRYEHAAYSWDLQGNKLVFQRFQAGSSGARPEVLVWSKTDGSFELIAEDATQPQWIP